jgi:hypothetical protein
LKVKPVIAGFCMLLFAISCGQQLPELEVGGIYSVYDSTGNYRVAKIVAVDSSAVHLRVYGNKFSSRPEKVDASMLSLGTSADQSNQGLNHLPLRLRAFAKWEPVFLYQEPVTDEELEAFRTWERMDGTLRDH